MIFYPFLQNVFQAFSSIIKHYVILFLVIERNEENGVSLVELSPPNPWDTDPRMAVCLESGEVEVRFEDLETDLLLTRLIGRIELSKEDIYFLRIGQWFPGEPQGMTWNSGKGAQSDGQLG